MTRRRWRALAAAGLLTVLYATVDSPAEAAPRATTTQTYEVWVTDAAENELLVYSGTALEDSAGPRNEADVIDLAALFELPGPNNSTGLAVSGPQTVDASPDGRYVAVVFAESGHVAVFDAKTHQPKTLILPSASRRGRLTTAASDASPVSSAQWLADGSAIVLANQGTKRVERINYDATTDSFAFDGGAAFDLTRCTTPGGKPCQSTSPADPAAPGYFGPDNRPDITPTCVVPTDRGHVLVTLAGGGLFVLDPTATPMHLVAAYGNQSMGREACGGAQTDRFVHLAADTATASDPFQYSLYQVRDNFPRAPRTIADNEPQRAPKLFWRSPDGTMAPHPRAMTIAGSANALWNLERSSGMADVFSPTSLARVTSVPLAGDLLSDPRPVVAAPSPDGKRLFVLLGGTMPGEKGASQPLGLGVVTITASGTGGSLTDLLGTADAVPMVEHPIEPPTTTAPSTTVPDTTAEPVTTAKPTTTRPATARTVPVADTAPVDTAPVDSVPMDAAPTDSAAASTTTVKRTTTSPTPTRPTLSASGATTTTRKASSTTVKAFATTASTRRAAAPTTSTRKGLGIGATATTSGAPTKLAGLLPSADLVAKPTTTMPAAATDTMVTTMAAKPGTDTMVTTMAAKPMTTTTVPAPLSGAGTGATALPAPAEPGGMAVVMAAKS